MMNNKQLLIQEIRKVKIAMQNDPMVLERMKGLFLVEEKEDECDYRIQSNFNEIKIRSCKNNDKRLPESERGFLLYGKNVTIEKFRDIMNAFRTQMREKVPLRTIESVTK
jgi:coenzyme F420-reducing hydrogenase delta subunit